VAAGGRIARVVKEDDPEVGAVVLRLRDEAAVHVRVAARLVDEQPAHLVEVLCCEAPLLEDRPPFERWHPARDDPERFARGVVIDRLQAAYGTSSSRTACSSSSTEIAPSNFARIVPEESTTNTHGSVGSFHSRTQRLKPFFGSLSV